MDPAASKVTPLSPQADSANVAGVRFSCWEHSAARLLTQSDPPLPPNSLIPDACPPPPSSQKLWRAVEVGDREIMREKGTFPTLDAVAGGLKGAVSSSHAAAAFVHQRPPQRSGQRGDSAAAGHIQPVLEYVHDQGAGSEGRDA